MGKLNIIKKFDNGLIVLIPELYNDSRGYFTESYNYQDFLNNNIIVTNFIQDNESSSSYGVVRGLHYQKPPYAQSKLVRCTKSVVLYVAVDIRKGSPTYGKYTYIGTRPYH